MKKYRSYISFIFFSFLCFITTYGQVEFKLELLPDNLTYSVKLRSNVTWNSPDNMTLSGQVTLVVPHGGFVVSSLTDINGTWAPIGPIETPLENPGFDYWVIMLNVAGATSDIEYQSGVETELFRFQNAGNCTGAVELMASNDPFSSPNSLQLNVGNSLTILGNGAGNNAWLGNYDVGNANCVNCDVEYAIDSISPGIYEVSLIAGETWTGTAATTSSLQVTLKVPTGGFTSGSVTSLIPGVNFDLTSRWDAPSEAPSYDYLAFTLTTPGTRNITYIEGQKTPLFTFENTGSCTGSEVSLVKEGDPFLPPNSEQANIGQQLTTFGGGVDIPICLVNGGSAPCSVMSPACTLPVISQVSSSSPSLCGINNGNITISATSDQSLQYSIDNGSNWFSNNVFADLEPGSYNIIVRVVDLPQCTVTYASNPVILFQPGGATIQQVQTSNPASCDSDDGMIIITAISGGSPLEYSITGGTSWQSSNQFTNLPEGEYQVAVRTGVCISEYQNNPVNLTCTTNGTGVIEGQAFKDCNNAGIKDAGEEGIQGVTVTLSGGNIFTTTTGSDGRYRFENLVPGNYTVHFASMAGTAFSPQDQGSDDTVDSDVNVGGQTNVISISADQIISNVYAGYRDTAAPQISFVHPLLMGLSNGDTLFMECGATEVFSVDDATAIDNCDSVPLIRFVEDPPVNNPDCSSGYITMMHCGWIATDNCGNQSEVFLYFIIKDETPPVLRGVPADVHLTSNDPLPPVAAVSAVDFCDADVPVSYTEAIDTTDCLITIVRKWEAMDNCGNSVDSIQHIYIEIQLDISVLVEPESCDENDGVATISPSIYHYAWQDGITGAFREDLVAGTYSVTATDTQTGCQEVLSVVISNDCACAEPIIEEVIITDAICGEANGAATILVVGNEDDFTYRWIPNRGVPSVMGSERSGLLPGTYLVFIAPVGQPDCITKQGVVIGNDISNCLTVPDTNFIASKTAIIGSGCDAGEATLCLDIPYGEFTKYFSIDNSAGDRFNGEIEGCNYYYYIDYHFDNLPDIETSGQYELRGWNVGSLTFSGAFTSLADLVLLMNQWDPAGGWEIVDSTLAIHGEGFSDSYGFMEIFHPASGTTSLINLNATSKPLGTMIHLGFGQEELFITNQLNNYVDTLSVTAVCVTPDFIEMEVPKGSVVNVPLDKYELPGQKMDVFIFYENEIDDVAQLRAFSNSGSVEIWGEKPGLEGAAVVMCDENSICDTTYLQIRVIEKDESNQDDTGVVVYNGFSPNGDGLNDFLKISGLSGYPDYTLSIFNRWGSLVYKSNDYKNDWYGRWEGKDLPDGTYFYSLDLGKKRLNGFIQILR